MSSVRSSVADVTLQSAVSPHLQTLDPSVHIVARHNFAAPAYSNDDTQRRQRSGDYNKLWLQ